MARQRTTFGKLQRERAKRAKAAAKRERRQNRGAETELDDDAGAGAEADLTEGEELSAPELLARIEELHARFDAGRIPFEDFEEQKTELFERLAKLPMD
jgi:hypothetical protein